MRRLGIQENANLDKPGIITKIQPLDDMNKVFDNTGEELRPGLDTASFCVAHGDPDCQKLVGPHIVKNPRVTLRKYDAMGCGLLRMFCGFARCLDHVYACLCIEDSEMQLESTDHRHDFLCRHALHSSGISRLPKNSSLVCFRAAVTSLGSDVGTCVGLSTTRLVE